ncbi:MAG: antitoxin [Pseudomonadota bacterium]
MKSLSLRGIQGDLAENLKKISQIEGTSLNKTVLKLLEASVGMRKKRRFNIYHDLDDLAGTWSSREEKEFKEKTQFFEKIDKDLWK